MKDKVIVIVGPTASGKSAVGIELAKKINGEIISCDSMQIYKGLDIGTAKVTKEEQAEVKHHLIDICDITKDYSVASFKKMCYDKIDDIISRKKIPILVGGTGLYINSVVLNMNFEEENNNSKEVEEYRNYLYTLAKEKSNDYVYNMLVEVDEESSKKIHKNNLKRVIRALEIAKFSNKKKSEYMLEEEKRLEKINEESKYQFLIYYIDYDREVLYERINDRVDKMMQSELMLKEAKFLYENFEKASSTCLQAIGYKEFFPYFKGENSLDNCIENLKKSTRNYAKRQITWFKNKINKKDIDGFLSTDEKINFILSDIKNS